MKIVVLNLSFLFFFLTIFTAIAQDYQDVVYLRNGNIVKGFIIELIPDDYLDIRTTSGRVRTIDIYDVDRIVKERVRGESSMLNERSNNSNQYQSITRPSQNNARSLQNDNRYSQNNNRVIQNDYRYNSRNSYNNYYDGGYYERKNYFGVKAGLNYSNMVYKYSKMNYKSGLHGGIFGEFRFNNFSIQPEMIISMQGAKAKAVDPNYILTEDYSMNYLNIPLMTKYYIFEGLSIEAGFQLGILLSSKVKRVFIDIYGNYDESGTIDIKELTKSTDFSLIFGVSYNIPNMPFGFYARYSLGLTDFVATEVRTGFDIPAIDIEEGKNRLFQAGVFLKF